MTLPRAGQEEENMSLVVVVEFRIHPQHIAAFRKAIVENARLSVANEPGCRQFDVCTDAGEPGLIYLYEIYDDDAAFQQHLASAHYLSMNAETTDWVQSKLVRKLRRVD
jgi:(4S)-4-hydroxy-5-phosphonooxypentane-2,3-dione isomerase